MTLPDVAAAAAGPAPGTASAAPRPPAGPAARDLVRLMATGEMSATEVVLDHVERICAVNPAINAVVAPRFEQALADAARLDAAFARGERVGRLHGLPVTVKECLDVGGMVTSGGVPRLAGAVRPKDAAVVRALRREGAIILGKTNLAQLSWGPETDNPVFGRTSNPWDLARTAGGSSGGEAAVVAAGGSPLGVGTDSGGSVRLPAHYCGLQGLKPTSGRLTDAGSLDARASFQRIVVNQPGLLARSVGDLDLVYRVLARDGDPPDGPARPGGQPGSLLAGLRVGFYTAQAPAPFFPAVATAVLDSVRVLESMGAVALEFEPPDPGGAARLFAAVFALDGGARLRDILGGSPRSQHLDMTLAAIEGTALSRRDARELARSCTRYRWAFASAMAAEGIDVIVCPPAAAPAPPHGMGSTVSVDTATLYNLLGMPAGVVAVSRVTVAETCGVMNTGRDGQRAPTRAEQPSLPIGVQVAAPAWCEETVLRVMAALEAANTSTGVPWAGSAVPVVRSADHDDGAQVPAAAGGSDRFVDTGEFVAARDEFVELEAASPVPLDQAGDVLAWPGVSHLAAEDPKAPVRDAGWAQ